MAIYRGTLYERIFNIKSGGVPLDLTDATFAAWLVVTVGDTVPVLVLSTDPGGGMTIPDGPGGKLQISITAAQSKLLPLGVLWSDLMRTDLGDPQRYCGMRFTVRKPATIL